MHRFRLLCFALVFCAAGDAFAAGFYLPGRGVRPLGRAGAMVASGNGDLNSLWYNPANLTLDKFQLTVDLALIDLAFEHTRAPRTLDNGDVRTYDAVKNEAPLKTDPQLLLGGPLPFDGFSWAFGVYAPYLSGHTFPEDGAQRYVLVDNDPSLLLFLHLAVSWEINDSIRVGVGFQNVPAHFVLVNVASGYTGVFGDPEDEDLDILAEVVMDDFFAPSGNAGVWIRLSDSLSAGLSFQAPVVFSTKNAKLRVRLPSHPEFQFAETVGDQLAGSLKFPAVARFGVALTRPKFDVELAATYEGWSIAKEINAVPTGIQVENLPGIGTLPVGPLSVPLEWQDTFSVRLGSEIKVSEKAQVRAGYAFETSAIPDERYSVFLADGNKHLFAAGGTFQFTESFGMDAGLGYYFIPTRNITNSEWRQINPTDTEGKVTLVVGNGEYKQSYFAFGLGTYVRF